MNHVLQIQKLWKMFKFVNQASAEELVQFGFVENDVDNHVYKQNCWLDEDDEPAFHIKATRIHGKVTVLVQTSEDASSYQLAGVAAVAIRADYRNVETNMVRDLVDDTVTIRASNTGKFTWMSDGYGSTNAHMVDKSDEAVMFQTSLVVDIPTEYVYIQDEMIDVLLAEKEKEFWEFDKIILTYTYPIVDLQIPDVPELK